MARHCDRHRGRHCDRHCGESRVRQRHRLDHARHTAKMAQCRYCVIIPPLRMTSASAETAAQILVASRSKASKPVLGLFFAAGVARELDARFSASFASSLHVSGFLSFFGIGVISPINSSDGLSLKSHFPRRFALPRFHLRTSSCKK